MFHRSPCVGQLETKCVFNRENMNTLQICKSTVEVISQWHMHLLFVVDTCTSFASQVDKNKFNSVYFVIPQLNWLKQCGLSTKTRGLLSGKPQASIWAYDVTVADQPMDFGQSPMVRVQHTRNSHWFSSKQGDLHGLLNGRPSEVAVQLFGRGFVAVFWLIISQAERFGKRKPTACLLPRNPQSAGQRNHHTGEHHSLTHWGRDKMAAFSQTAFSNAFSSMKIFEFWLQFHRSLFPRVQLTIFQHWFR